MQTLTSTKALSGIQFRAAPKALRLPSARRSLATRAVAAEQAPPSAQAGSAPEKTRVGINGGRHGARWMPGFG